MEHAVVPLTVVILVILFLIQRNGTSWIGGIFGPVMLVWFIVAGVLGIVGIAKTPAVLAALSPLPAITYLWHAGPLAFVVIGGAFLAVTGGEAFYADMGHFGPFPIRVAWFGVALPALTLNYFGQGGLLLAEPERNRQPVLSARPAMVALRSGRAGDRRDRHRLPGDHLRRLFPDAAGHSARLSAAHERRPHRRSTRSARSMFRSSIGRSPLATLAAVIGFGSSDALAGAYGIAVSLLMAITTLMATFVALHWKHNPIPRLCGQRQPACPRPALFRLDLDQALRRRLVPLAHRLRHRIPHAHLAQGRGDHGHGSAGDSRAVRRSSSNDLSRDPPLRIPGTAVVLGRMAKGVPLALSHNIKCNHVLHENVLLVAVTTTETPRVADEDRVVVTPIADGHNARRAALRLHGAAQRSRRGSNVAVARGQIAKFDLARVIYYTGHETIIPSGRRPGLARWREALFAFMHHNAQRPGAYFKIPSAQIMEIGVEFEI